MVDTGTIITLAAVSAAPGLFWLWYFYRRDRFAREPLFWILEMFLLGMLVILPVGLVESFLGKFIPDSYLAVFIAPVIEETGKFLVVWLTVYRTAEFDEPVDGMVYATSAALGFATLENVGYVFASYGSSFPAAIETGVFRALLSVPAHALFSAIWGYSLGMARFSEPRKGRHLIIRGLAIAMIFHGLFNLLVFNYTGLAILVLILIPTLWWIVSRDFAKALRWQW